MDKLDDDFVIPERFDKKYAADGVWFDIEDASGNNWGSFKLALLDYSVPRMKMAIDRNERKNKAKLKQSGGGKDEAVQLSMAIDTALDTYLLDWKITGKSGKAIPFTRDKVHAYFGRKYKDEETGENVYPVLWVSNKLMSLSTDPLNFQPDDEQELPEKN